MSSLEHACFHEAGHIVSQWLDGGDAKGSWVCCEDAMWWGVSHLPQVDEIGTVKKLALGGLSEIRYEEGDEWIFDVDPCAASLLAATQSPQPTVEILLPAHDSHGNAKILHGHKYVNFSDDLMVLGLPEAAKAYPAEMKVAFEEAVSRIIDPQNWVAIKKVADALKVAPAGVCDMPGGCEGQHFDHYLDEEALQVIKNEVMPPPAPAANP